MKKHCLLTALAVVMIAASTFAAVSAEHTAWAEGPVQHLMTREETAAWKGVDSDEKAAAFVALFWARRDPTPDTPRNEFRDEFDRRAKAADEQFGTKKLRGSMSERGRALILYGIPSKVERSRGATAVPQAMSEDGSTSQQPAEPESQTWTYEGDSAKELFGSARATIRFTDRYANGEFRADRSGADLGKAQQRAIALAIRQPALTAAPAFATAAAPPAAPAAPAAQAVATELATEALRSAVASFKAAATSPYEKKIFASWGEFVTADGETFVPLMLYVPKAAGLTAGQNLTFFGVVQDANGANVLAFEEPATLAASKDDLFVDHSVTLGGGKYRAFLGLAENGVPVSITAADLDVSGKLDKDAPAVSSLILSNNIYPLTEAQLATDPFAFGGVKVIPKADRRFTTADELWYFFEMRNPGLPEAAGVAGAEAAAAAPAPKLQVKIDVEATIDGRKVKKSAPPLEVEAIAMKGVPGHYGVGNAIPLASFKPGDYTFTVKVIDTVRKATYTMTDKFTVVP